MIKVSINDNLEEEKFILITIIGITESLLNNTITIFDAEKAIFSPFSVNLLKEQNIHESIIDLVEQGCELEDIESLLPDKLNDTISSIKIEAIKLLTSLKHGQSVEKWLID